MGFTGDAKTGVFGTISEEDWPEKQEGLVSSWIL